VLALVNIYLYVYILLTQTGCSFIVILFQEKTSRVLTRVAPSRPSAHHPSLREFSLGWVAMGSRTQALSSPPSTHRVLPRLGGHGLPHPGLELTTQHSESSPQAGWPWAAPSGPWAHYSALKRILPRLGGNGLPHPGLELTTQHSESSPQVGWLWAAPSGPRAHHPAIREFSPGWVGMRCPIQALSSPLSTQCILPMLGSHGLTRPGLELTTQHSESSPQAGWPWAAPSRPWAHHPAWAAPSRKHREYNMHTKPKKNVLDSKMSNFWTAPQD
jgi:hypothetical protein